MVAVGFAVGVAVGVAVVAVSVKVAVRSWIFSCEVAGNFEKGVFL